MKAAFFLFVAACGGTVATGDDADVARDAAPDAAVTVEASAEASVVFDAAPDADGQSCFAADASYTCAPDQDWTWFDPTVDAGGVCSQGHCPVGTQCTLVNGTTGVCE